MWSQGWGHSLVVKHMPSIWKVLGSISSNTKDKKNTKEERKGSGEEVHAIAHEKYLVSTWHMASTQYTLLNSNKKGSVGRAAEMHVYSTSKSWKKLSHLLYALSRRDWVANLDRAIWSQTLKVKPNFPKYKGRKWFPSLNTWEKHMHKSTAAKRNLPRNQVMTSCVSANPDEPTESFVYGRIVHLFMQLRTNFISGTALNFLPGPCPHTLLFKKIVNKKSRTFQTVGYDGTHL